MNIQQLAAYLPYKVKVQTDDYHKYIATLSTECGNDMVDIDWCLKRPSTKLLLRDMADISKPIVVDGVEIIPAFELVGKKSDYSKLTAREVDIFPTPHESYKIIKIEHEDLGEVFNIPLNNILSLPYNMIQKLLKYHFDIFSLPSNDFIKI